MKTWILLLLVTFSCTNKTIKKIEVVSIQPVAGIETQESNLAVSHQTSIVILTNEDFYTINPKMSFGFVAVEKPGDFKLPQKELVKKQLIFDVVYLKMIKRDHYQFFINSAYLAPYQTLYCRLERPGFLLKGGYQSPVFELNLIR